MTEFEITSNETSTLIPVQHIQGHVKLPILCAIVWKPMRNSHVCFSVQFGIEKCSDCIDNVKIEILIYSECKEKTQRIIEQSSLIAWI